MYVTHKSDGYSLPQFTPEVIDAFFELLELLDSLGQLAKLSEIIDALYSKSPLAHHYYFQAGERKARQLRGLPALPDLGEAVPRD
jgi:hypothetical protein